MSFIVWLIIIVLGVILIIVIRVLINVYESENDLLDLENGSKKYKDKETTFKEMQRKNRNNFHNTVNNPKLLKKAVEEGNIAVGEAVANQG